MSNVSPDDTTAESTKFVCRGYKFIGLLRLDEIQDDNGNEVRTEI